MVKYTEEFFFLVNYHYTGRLAGIEGIRLYLKVSEYLRCLIFQDRFWFLHKYHIIFALCEFSMPVFIGGFSLKSEWQKISSKYPSWF